MVEGKKGSATRLWIGDVLEGRFTLQENSFVPQEFCLQNGSVVDRIALCGLVVENQYLSDNPFLLLDDGSGVVSVRAFEMPECMRELSPGHIVFVIGRPKLFMNVVYIFAEIIKGLSDVLWLEVWKKTVPHIQVIKTPIISVKKEQEAIESDDVLDEKIISFIRENDVSDGVEIEEVVRESKISDCEIVIAGLLLKGRVFEVSPGRIKVLE